MPLLGLDFPPVSHVTDWPTLFGHGFFAVIKVVLLEWLATVIVLGFFWIAGRPRRLVPAGAQNLAEAVIEFVQNQIVLPAMGPEGMSWTPFLVTLFTARKPRPKSVGQSVTWLTGGKSRPSSGMCNPFVG